MLGHWVKAKATSCALCWEFISFPNLSQLLTNTHLQPARLNPYVISMTLVHT